ncbi:MAG: 2-C-methyl-D-erythritol 2,4-cyclodiphosphate synthase [Acidobacteria bacterium]|nr:2-C-methyl-D-erythritol 2,4-cyclodiphosphate synthase [Acidobacteriota bacterium]
MRIGFGNDIHRLGPERPLIIGGVVIPSDIGAIGHSDADVLFHAVTDAILGALAIGDIGSHFSDLDHKWKDADSSIFLAEAIRLMRERKYVVGNIDSTISLEKPKIRKFIDQMRANLAGLLGVEIGLVSVKAKTGEGLDAVGESRAIKAEACCLLLKQD